MGKDDDPNLDSVHLGHEDIGEPLKVNVGSIKKSIAAIAFGGLVKLNLCP
jgi:hypothetical protein